MGNLKSQWTALSFFYLYQTLSVEIDQSILCYLVLLVLLAIEWPAAGPVKVRVFSQATPLWYYHQPFVKGTATQNPHNTKGLALQHAQGVHIAQQLQLPLEQGITDWHLLAQESLSHTQANSAMPIWSGLSVHARGHSSLTCSLSQHHRPEYFPVHTLEEQHGSVRKKYFKKKRKTTKEKKKILCTSTGDRIRRNCKNGNLGQTLEK